MGLYTTATEAITTYTSLSPAAFFTIAAMMVVVYKVVSEMFVAFVDYKAVQREQQQRMQNMMAPVSDPVQLGDVTEVELRAYDGSDPKKPLLMAIKGHVYDVSRSRMFYGPGGPYALFAGRDASRALALMSFEPIDLTGNIEGLSSDELEVLQDWEYKFREKYAEVGQLVAEKTSTKENEIESHKSKRIMTRTAMA